MTGSGTRDPRSPLHRRLLSGSAWVFGGRVGTMLLGLAISALLARLLTKAELGAYFTSFTLVIIGASIAQLGLDRAVIRLVASSLGLGQPGRARGWIVVVLTIGTLGTAVMAVLTLSPIGKWLLTDLFGAPALGDLLPLVAGWVIGTAMQSLAVESFRGLQRFGEATVLDALLTNAIVASVLGGLFVFADRATLTGVLAIWAGASLVAAAVGLVLLSRRLHRLGPSERVSRRHAVRVALPLLVTSLGIYLLGSGVDLLILGAFQPQSEVALYGAASRLVVFVATPFMIFSGVIPPIVAELHSQGKMRELERSLRAGATLAGLPAFLILVVFVLFGPFVMRLVYGPGFEEAVPILIILSLGRLVAVWAGSAGITLMMTGNQRAMMNVTLVSGTVSVGAGLLAAPRFGAVGVAVATAGAQVIQNVLQLMLARRRLGVWTAIHLSPRPLISFFRGREEFDEAAEEVAEALAASDDGPESERER